MAVRYSHDQAWPEPQPWAYKRPPPRNAASNGLGSADVSQWVKEQAGDAWTGEAKASLEVSTLRVPKAK
jgi:hypothetical protein